MTPLLLVLALVVAAVILTLHAVRGDGYGHRPGPRSRIPDHFGNLQPRDRW